MATRKNSTDRIGWADLVDDKVDGGCSPIVKGEINYQEALGFEDCFNLIYDARTDTIFQVHWKPGDGNGLTGSALDTVGETLDEIGDQI